jgi:hypothetical protein
MRTRIFVLALLLLAACTSSGDAEDGSAADETSTIAATVPTTVPATTTTSTTVTTSTTAATTTTAPTTTTTAPTTTTSTAATTTTNGGPYLVGTPELYPLAPLPGSNGAAGSGCAPGAGALPDGVWFGYVLAKSAADIDFDLACFYFGDIAYDEGALDGEEVNNDYYVRNANPTLRTIPVDPAVTVYEIDAGSTGYLEIPFSARPVDPSAYLTCPSDWCGVWLFVNGGNVTEILEQFVP